MGMSPVRRAFVILLVAAGVRVRLTDALSWSASAGSYYQQLSRIRGARSRS
jgi:hypothetical protein